MIHNFRKIPIPFYPPIDDVMGQKNPDFDNELILNCAVSYKNFWEIDGQNTEQYRIDLQVVIDADAPVVESWRIFYNDNMYTVWQVDAVLHPLSGRVLYKVAHTG